ncbi:Hypothetical predicted protein [Olea europaea subsp. europaea]|uniref:DUF1985 domain-containing protein n=1 Tax=Olea europaea subsp. europaea TaxID=158383 RepID=A0A8S0PY09_OLEEU|nr:Hypothetical predicted protein [Olea europaea subsp. europaea]
MLRRSTLVICNIQLLLNYGLTIIVSSAAIMEFQFLVPENEWLSARISQRSNLKYIKTVMDNFDDRLRADFSEIQFSTHLIQALVCQGIRCDKSHELWFNVQGHLTRFGLQEYVIVTGLHAGSFSEGDRYTKALKKRRLKEKYFKSLEKISCAQLEKAFLRASTPGADRYKLGLALIVEGVITAPDNNVSIDEDTLAIVDNLELFFAYPWAKVGIRPCLHSVWTDINATFVLLSSGQIWAYEAMPELGERFAARARHTRPTEVERDLPYIVSLAPFPDRPVQFLDDLARRVVGPQGEDVDIFASDGHHTPEGNGDDRSKPDDSGESGRDPSSETGGSDSEDEVDASGRQSGALPTPVVAPSTSGVQGTRGGVTLMREDVEGMLYDQCILFEMRLRTVKLEIMQHVTEEFARLRDFISTLVPPSSGTSTSAAAPVVNEPNLWDDPHEDMSLCYCYFHLQHVCNFSYAFS